MERIRSRGTREGYRGGVMASSRSTASRRANGFGQHLTFLLALLAGTVFAPSFAIAGPSPAQQGPPSRSGPTLAVEDTIHALVSEPLPEVLVTAPRQTLDEILRHVAEGEAFRDSMIDDQAFTLFVRMTGRDTKKDALEESEPYLENVTRIYQKRPGKLRTVTLKEWSRYDDKAENEEGSEGKLEIKGSLGGNGEERAAEQTNQREKDADQAKSGVSVNVDSDMSEQFVAFAFDPKTRSRFHFRIEDRKIIGDQVVYVIAFSPKSPLDVLPSGRAWVNTNDFVILREEFSYRDRSPAPLFMESLDSCVLERTRIDGRYWVLSRVLARVTLTDPVRWMGKLTRTKVPKVADFAIRWDDWIINGDIPDSLFLPAGQRGGKR